MMSNEVGFENKLLGRRAKMSIFVEVCSFGQLAVEGFLDINQESFLFLVSCLKALGMHA